MLGLHLDQRFDIAHQGPNGRSGPNGVVVFADVGEHGVDVRPVERTGSRETQVNFL